MIGFIAGRYDINAVKAPLMKHFTENEGVDFVVKRNNTFMCVKTSRFKFLDMCNYIAPGFSYAKYLKAFGCEEGKGYFPYEWMNLERLNETSLPPHDAFYSNLKQANISDEEYAYCQQVWREHKMETCKDFLVWYNNLDVKPFLQAIEKQTEFYRERRLDMFKDGISIPGLTMQYLFQDLDQYFTLVDESNEDLFWLIKNGIVGGPSIIFHRHHEKDVTRLREARYGPQARVCKKILGYDANALYLWALSQQMPTGFAVRRHAPEFKPEHTRQRGNS